MARYVLHSLKIKESKMKILTLTPWYPNPANNGAGTFVKEQMSVIAKYGEHDVIVIATFPTNKFSEIDVKSTKLEKGSLTEILVPYKPEKTIFDKFMKRKSAIKKGFAKINSLKPDLFHVHEYQMVPIARSLISDVPIILTEHSSTLSANLGIKKYLAISAFKKANVIIAVSEYQRNKILSLEKNAKVFVINNFVDDIFLNAKKVIRVDNNEIRIISVGNLIDKKGFKFLINVTSKLDQRFSLTIVGDGPQKEELRVLVNELKLENKVFFTGSLDRISVLKKLTESDIFVSASKIETFGIAILEALAVGLPVVTYDNGGVRDFMTDSCGIIVTDYTTEAFVNSINVLVNNINEYDPLKIKNYVIKNFSAEKFAEKLNKIYKENTVCF